jgi:heterodisulfide reductase subunit C2
MSGASNSPAPVCPAGPSPEDTKTEDFIPSAISPDLSFLETVERESGVKVSACFQCGKCSNGCPVAFAMDYHPYQVVRFIHMGLRDRLVNSSTIWICASCHTCVTRCPNDVDIPRLMDYLKEKVCSGEGKIAEKKTELFHRQFFKSIRNHGRVFEGGFMQAYLIRSGAIWNISELIKNALLGRKLAFKRRFRFLPSRIKGISEIRSFFRS